MPAIVEVDRLSKDFGKVRALYDVSFSVSEGEVFGFLGPNGAGKTTTIRILLGLLRPDRGTASIGGHYCWADHGSAARLFGATLEQPGLYGYLSGRDNLRQFARMLGPVDDRRITDLLAMVGMTERGDDKVKRCWEGRACSSSTSRPTAWTPTASMACAFCSASSQLSRA